MNEILLKCGYRLNESAIAAIMSASPDQIEWRQEEVLQHSLITDVVQWQLVPVSIAGIPNPNSAIACVLKTQVVEGEDRGREYYLVESSADHIECPRVLYSRIEKKMLVAETSADAKRIVLEEIKRFLKDNLP